MHSDSELHVTIVVNLCQTPMTWNHPFCQYFLYGHKKTKLCNVRSRCRRCQWHECLVNYLNFTIGWLSLEPIEMIAVEMRFEVKRRFIIKHRAKLVLSSFRCDFLCELQQTMRLDAQNDTIIVRFWALNIYYAYLHSYEVELSCFVNFRLSVPKVKIKTF